MVQSGAQQVIVTRDRGTVIFADAKVEVSSDGKHHHLHRRWR